VAKIQSKTDLSDFQTKPNEFDDNAKLRAEIIESYLKSRDLLRPEIRRLATWTAMISTLISLTAITFTIVSNNAQSAASKLDLATKANELSLKQVDLQKQSDLLAKGRAQLTQSENDFKIKQAQLASQLQAFDETKAQLVSLKAQLDRLRASTSAPYLGDVNRIADAATAAVHDSTEIGDAFSKTQSTTSESNGVTAKPSDRASSVRQLALSLFDPALSVRDKAFDTIVANYLGDADTCSVLITTASEHLDNAKGISNSLEIIRLSDWGLVRKNAQSLTDLVSSVRKSKALMTSPLIIRRINLIEDRLDRHKAASS
jgi:hypothetical protein